MSDLNKVQLIGRLGADPEIRQVKKEAPFIRFMKSYYVCEKTGCWMWMGIKGTNGYGQIKAFGSMVSAHRFSFELYNGPLAEGSHVMHSCDTKLCVNPDHLSAGSHAENMRQAAERRLMRSGKDHPNYGKKQLRPKQSIPVRVLGVEYDSQKSAERALNLGSGTVAYWLKNSPSKAQKLNASG